MEPRKRDNVMSNPPLTETSIPWVKRESPAFGTKMTCAFCGGLKPWAMFDRKTGRGVCDACRAAGHRLGEKDR